MNKGDLIGMVATQMGTSKADAARAVDAVLISITDGLRADRRVTLSGFGTFVKKHRAARTGMSPSTGEPIPIRASNTCGFRASDSLREAI